MADSETNDPSDPGFPGHEPASRRLQHMSFPVAMRGYDRDAVDEFVQSVQAEIAHLEAMQTPQGVVQRALDEVGAETASILQRAHEAADQLSARSRIEAEERVQRAQSEADQLRREADEYSEQVVADTRALWEERLRLIDDIRQLADQVLSTADDAIERVQMPEPLGFEDADPEPTTGEGPVGVPAEQAGGPPWPAAVEAEPTPDDTAAWGVGEVEAEPPEAQSGAYDAAHAYGTGGFADDSLDAETAPYRIGAVEHDPPPGGGSLAPDEDSGHTVELEALPGGAAEDDESPPDPERSWDRERD